MSDIVQVAEMLRGAGRVVALTGAGMSAEAGVPTFRDGGGVWKNFRPEELASPEGFARDPLRVWAWYRERRAGLARIEPHEGHRVLARWEARFESMAVVTQNVDGLHHRAGSQRVFELHGRLDETRCVACECRIVGLDDLGPDPRCACGARMRPGVVWFGELLPVDTLEAGMELARQADVCLVIGTSGVVYPAASVAEVAKQGGAAFVEINPQPGALASIADVCLRGGAVEMLTKLDDAVGR
ncbi:MAG: NAD-dependent deacylase [Phycisphaerales bacterium]|nr:NAD-dependent deacylase [Phycisphaerales bacterium]